MIKNKKIKIVLVLCVFTLGNIFAQKNWDNYNFEKENKRKVTVKGASAKSLKANKSLIARYEIGQAIFMKGTQRSSRSSDMFSKISLGGLNNENYQKMVNELHQEFEKELTNIGLKLTTGEDVMTTKTAQKYIKKNKDHFFIGNIGNKTIIEGKKKISEGSIPKYPVGAVVRDVKFQPTNKVVYYTDNVFQSGLMNQNMTTKEKVNLITAKYFVTFASFDGGKGYKKITLSTKPILAVGVEFTIMTPGAKMVYIIYGKLPIWGSSNWSKGIVETKDNEGMSTLLGLARSTGYAVDANSELFLNEVKAIISALQKDIVKAIKQEI